ncbi:MAG: hypothetical protein WA655_07355 [Candidatus Korobacteraceae bacterium]
MAQSVRVNALADAGVHCRYPAGVPDDLVGDGSVHTPPFHDAGKDVGCRFHPAPVLAQCLQQFGTERHVPVAFAFALVNVDLHEFLIEIGGFQLHQFGAADAGGVESHQDGAV